MSAHSVTPSPLTYSFLGCFTDLVPERVLPALRTVSPSMTTDVCATICADYPLFGTEYSDECYCALVIDSNSEQKDDSACSYPCAGDPSTTCGGSALLSVYSHQAASPASDPESIGNFAFQGCWTDLTPGRVLPVSMGASGDMTPELCATLCAGYAWFGVEFADECYCADAIDGTSEQVDTSNCQMSCSGSSSEICGGSALLSLYHDTTGDTTTTPPGSGLVAPQTVNGYNYQGCYSDLTSVGRVLSAMAIQGDDQMSIESCASTCAAYPWFGVEYSKECYCGQTLDPTSQQQPDDTVCNMPCSGNPAEPCGGSALLTVYNNPNVALPSSPAQAGDYAYVQCWQDDVADRSLQGAVFIEADMTAEICAQRCAGYLWFGVEYADECYCSNTLLSSHADEADCDMTCSGNNMELCGGPNRLSLYTYQPAAPPGHCQLPNPRDCGQQR